MTAWKISASSADFDRLRESEAFAELLTLGRAANLLRDVLLSVTGRGKDRGSSAARSRMATTLLLTGLVAEAIPLLERSGKHFRHLPAFSRSIIPLLADAGLQSHRKTWFAPLRNQAVFHNDAVVSVKGLELLKPAVPQALAEGGSASFLGTYYPTSDVVAILYVIDAAGATADPGEFLGNAVKTVVDLSMRICLAMDALTGEAFADLGLRVESVSNDAE